MSRKDADLVLTIVNKRSVAYLTPITDPMFSTSNKSVNITTQNAGDAPFYLPEPLASVIGCAQQVRCHRESHFT